MATIAARVSPMRWGHGARAPAAGGPVISSKQQPQALSMPSPTVPVGGHVVTVISLSSLHSVSDSGGITVTPAQMASRPMISN